MHHTNTPTHALSLQAPFREAWSLKPVHLASPLNPKTTAPNNEWPLKHQKRWKEKDQIERQPENVAPQTSGASGKKTTSTSQTN